MQDHLTVEPIEEVYDGGLTVQLSFPERLALIAAADQCDMTPEEWATGAIVAKLGHKLRWNKDAVRHIGDVASAARQHAELVEGMPPMDALRAMQRLYYALASHYEELIDRNETYWSAAA